MPEFTSGKSDRSPKRSRVVQLAQMLLDNGEITEQRLAATLALTPDMLAAYLAGERPMPFDCQASLAQLLIGKFPNHAKAGRQLRDQLRATETYESGETTRHMSWTTSPFGIRIR